MKDTTSFRVYVWEMHDIRLRLFKNEDLLKPTLTKTVNLALIAPRSILYCKLCSSVWELTEQLDCKSMKKK